MAEQRSEGSDGLKRNIRFGVYFHESERQEPGQPAGQNTHSQVLAEETRMNSDHELPRRGLAPAAWTLASCGGGLGGFAGLPGTGGTGISSFGSISGFGSVIVNSIKFDDLQVIRMDGDAATTSDLRIGMVANVQGVRGTTVHWVLPPHSVWSIAQGVVSQVSTGQFNLAGMTPQTSNATV